MVLRDLLRCAYDADAWAQELAFLERQQSTDILGCVDRVSSVLEDRVQLFTRLQGSLGAFKAGLLKQADHGGGRGGSS